MTELFSVFASELSLAFVVVVSGFLVDISNRYHLAVAGSCAVVIVVERFVLDNSLSI